MADGDRVRVEQGPRRFEDPDAAVARVTALYRASTDHLRTALAGHKAHGDASAGRVRACYPYVAVTTDHLPPSDTALSYGFVDEPGRYAATLTRPDIFGRYYREQFAQLIGNHRRPLEIGLSDTPIPIHFAYETGMHVEGDLSPSTIRTLRERFDVPDLATMDDSIVNGTHQPDPGAARPLALFTAPRVDYSLHRLRHYTATSPAHFQNFVLFTNYQDYMDRFVADATRRMADGDRDYTHLIGPGDTVLTNARLGGGQAGDAPARQPQMPAWHLKAEGDMGITLINIGVGPSNAKTITDHVAVLRPHAWVMLGHCAGLRNTQKLGDYVLAHGYVREDHVLDADLPVWVPIPALAEIQVALQDAVRAVTGQDEAGVKSIMRTGTVATVDNRNWELGDRSEPVRRFSQSRAVALDMESATIAANGFRFRVPYGTLLCVSDKPLHGEIKLPGMADAFYRRQVGQHLDIGIEALERLRAMGPARLHSRKLRSFSEAAFQ